MKDKNISLLETKIRHIEPLIRIITGAITMKQPLNICHSANMGWKMRPAAARSGFQRPYFISSGRAVIGVTQAAGFEFWLPWQCSGLSDSQAAAAAACSQISLQTGTLTLGAVGTSGATRRRTADNLKPDRLSPSPKC